jgi:hypothetical protein
MFSVTERIAIAGTAEGFLPWFAPHSPVGLFHAWGPIPGVAEVLDQTGSWTVPGSTRTLRLSDGAQITECVLAFAPKGPFQYRMSGFASLLRSLVNHIDGKWHVENGDEPYRFFVYWTYEFSDRGRLARMALRIMSTAWRGYMRASLRQVARAFVTQGHE